MWRRGKNVSVGFRVFGKKKKKLKEKFRERKSKFFFDVLGMKILLSSCSLVGFYCGRGIFFKFEEKKESFWVCVTPLVGHHVD